MTRQSPPLGAIEAFIITAHSRTFREGAAKLALSPSALSRRIATLEGVLGTPLFDRSAAQIKLTVAGEAYRSEIEPAVDVIRRATAGMRLSNKGGPLRVQASQSFAVSWLMPRIASRAEDEIRSGIDLRIGRGLTGLRRGDVDMAVVSGPSELGGLPAEHLAQLDAAPVAAPALVYRLPPPRHVDELVEHERLGVSDPPGLWDEWLETAGCTDARGSSRVRYYDTLFMMYEAAAAGLGVTLGIPLLTERYFEEGKLRICIDARHPTRYFYSLVFASEAVRRRALARRFTDWVKAEADQSVRRFASL